MPANNLPKRSFRFPTGFVLGSLLTFFLTIFILSSTGALAFSPSDVLSAVSSVKRSTFDWVTRFLFLWALPQGHGWGLDADSVDSLHAASFALKSDFDSFSSLSSGKLSSLSSQLADLSGSIRTGELASFFQNASNLITGTLSDARLSSNVALLNSTQTFTGPKTFSSGTLTVAAGTTLSLSKGSLLDVQGSLSLPPGSITTADLADSSVTSLKILDGTIVNADVSSSASIAYSKLNLGGSITGSDLSPSIAIATTGNIQTTSGGTVTSSGLLTGSSGLSLGGNLTFSTDNSFDIGVAGANRPRNIYESGFIAIGSTPAQSLGAIRLSNAAEIRARNAGNTADNLLLTFDSSNRVDLGESGVTTFLQSGTIVASNLNSLSLGGTPAASGLVRIPHGAMLAARNSTNTGDKGILEYSSPWLYIGVDPSVGTNSAVEGTIIYAGGGTSQYGGKLRLGADANDYLMLGANSASTGMIRLPYGGTIMQRNSGNTADDQIWPLQTASACLSAAITIASAGSWYDGPSISLSAGTWYVSGQVLLSGGANSREARLWDGTTNYATAETGGETYVTTLPVSSIITLSSTTTIKISATSDGTTAQILASIANPAVSGDNLASCIRAFKVGN